MKKYCNFLILAILFFNCLLTISQETILPAIELPKKIFIDREKKTHPVFERVLPNVDIFLEKYKREGSRDYIYGVSMYFNNKQYLSWQINELIVQLNSKDNFDVSDLIKTYIFLTHADRVSYDFNWDTLNVDIINISKELNVSTNDSARTYNYKATFDFNSRIHKEYIYFIDDKVIFWVEEMFNNGKTGKRKKVKFTNATTNKAVSIAVTDNAVTLLELYSSSFATKQLARV